MKRILNSIVELTVLLGPHELVALVLFLATVTVWAVTLEAMYR